MNDFANERLSLSERVADAALHAANNPKARTFLANVERSLSPDQSRAVLQTILSHSEEKVAPQDQTPGPRIITMAQSNEERGRGTREDRIAFADAVISGRIVIVDNP